MHSSSELFRIKYSRVVFLISFILLWIFIGFRYETGADWSSYVIIMNDLQGTYLNDLNYSDFGYGLLNWISINYFGSIYFVQSVSAAITLYFSYKFLKILPNYWVGLSILFQPFFVYVSMNQTRQGVAIAIISYLIASELYKRSFLKTITLIFLAYAFHSTAILFFGIYIAASFLLSNKGRMYFIPIGVVIYVIGTYTSQRFSYLYDLYIEEAFVIESAMSFFALRIFITLVAALFLLHYVFRARMIDSWRGIFAASYLAIPISMYFFPDAIISIERFAAYWIFLQAIAFSQKSWDVNREDSRNVLIVSISYVILLFIWFRLSSVSSFWFPYQNGIF
jgi:hypothetical protein